MFFEIKKKFAYVREIGCLIESPKLRLYQHSPSHLMLQIRNHGAITVSGTGKPRNMVAGLSLDKAEVVALIGYLGQLKDKLP